MGRRCATGRCRFFFSLHLRSHHVNLVIFIARCCWTVIFEQKTLCGYKLYKSRNKMYENQHNLGCRLSFVSWMDLHTFYYWCDAMPPLSSGLVLRLCTKSANNPERVQHKNYIKKQSHRVFFSYENFNISFSFSLFFSVHRRKTHFSLDNCNCCSIS